MHARVASWWLWGIGATGGGIGVFAISTSLGLQDVARGIAADPGTPLQAHDRAQAYSSFWVHLVLVVLTCTVAILVLRNASMPMLRWKRANVVLGTLSFVAIESVSPIYSIAVYYDNMQMWSESQEQGLVFVAGLLAGAAWGLSALARLAVRADHAPSA